MLVLWTCILPPLKLLTMCLAVTLRTSSGCRGVTLGILGQLARFSLLDVYFVALLMLMLTDQDHRILVIDVHLAVLARPAIFLYLAAILLSLTAGEIIEQIEISRHDHNHEPYHDSRLRASPPRLARVHNACGARGGSEAEGRDQGALIVNHVQRTAYPQPVQMVERVPRVKVRATTVWRLSSRRVRTHGSRAGLVVGAWRVRDDGERDGE